MEKIENNMIQIPVEDDGDMGDNNIELEEDEEEEMGQMWYLATSDYVARDSNNRDMSLVKDEVHIYISVSVLKCNIV